MKRTLLLMMACSAVAPSNAGVWDWTRFIYSKSPANYGIWYCSDCQIIGPSENYNNQVLGQIAEYIRINNAEIHADKNELVDKWPPNSKITICDGTNCLDFYFDPLPLARWAPRTAARPQTSTDKPKVPKNPSPQTSAPPTPRTTVGLSGPPQATSSLDQYTISMPPNYPPPTTLKPSVTVIFYDTETVYKAPAADMPYELNNQIGTALGWGWEAAYLGM